MSLVGMAWRVEWVMALILMLGRGQSFQDNARSTLTGVKAFNALLLAVLAGKGSL